MGDRASYAIREGGVLSLFYGHWGAATLLADLFFGPEVGEARIRDQQPTDAWLDDVYGEAAAALCKDTRTLTFYDCRFSEAAQRTAAEMMRTTWPGWTVRAARYVSGVAAAVGVDLSAHLPPNPAASRSWGLDPLGARVDEPDQAWIDWTRGGRREVRIADAPLVPHLQHGPALTLALGALPTLAEVRRTRHTHAVAEERPAPMLSPGHGALCLVAIDEDAQTLRVTLLPGIPATGDLAALRDLSTRWPGWSVEARIGTAEEHFAALDAPVPPDLLAPEPEVPLDAQLRELSAILGDDGFKAWANAWLGRVRGDLGVPVQPQGIAPVDLPLEERARRFDAALSSLGLPEDTLAQARAAALEASTAEVRSIDPAAERAAAWGVPEAELVGQEDVVVGAARYAVHQPLLNGLPTGQARLLCAPGAPLPLTDGPVARLGRRWRPGSGRLLGAPSGRALLAVLETREPSLWWIDLERRTSTWIGEASRLARFDPEARIAWSPVGDRFALEALDTLAGEGFVVVYDAARGWIGEGVAAGWARWDGEVLAAGRWRVDGAGLVFDAATFTPTPEDAARARARMTGAAEGEEPELRRRAAVIRSDRAMLEARWSEGSEAEAHARRSLEADPSHAEAFQTLWGLLDHRWAERAEVAARFTGARDTDAEAWARWAEAAVASGDPQTATTAAARAVALAPHRSDTYRILARAQAQLGALTEAAAAAARAAALAPERIASLSKEPDLAPLHGHPGFAALDAVRLCWEAGHAPDPQARALLDRALACAPDRAETHAQRVTLERLAGEWVAAAKAIARWQAARPQDVGPRIEACALAVDQGELLRAEALAEALLLDPRSAAFGHLQRARIAALRGDEARALDELRAGEGRYPEAEHRPYDGFIEDHAARYPSLEPLLKRLFED